MSREYFTANGKLFPCPNKPHKFSVGRLMGQWRWAKESWAHMSDTGNLVTTFVGVNRTETPEGVWFISVIIWKLSVLIGLRIVNVKGDCNDRHDND